MSKKQKYIILLVIFIVLINLTACDELASNKIVKEAKSPNGKYTAFAFIRDAGATTDFSPQVSILKKKRLSKSEIGNVFRGYHSQYIDIKWQGNSTLVVYYDCNEDNIFEKANKIKGISIKYEKRNSLPSDVK